MVRLETEEQSMRFKKLPLLLAIAGLGLSSCGEFAPEESLDSSVDFEETATSEIFDSSSEEPIESTSSEEPIETTSSDEEPEEDDIDWQEGWPEEEIAAYLADYVGYAGEYSVPVPSDSDGKFTIETKRLMYSSSYSNVIEVLAKGDFTDYADEVAVAAGWNDVEWYSLRKGYSLLHTSDFELEIRVLAYDEEADTTKVHILPSQGEYGLWPEEQIAEEMTRILGTSTYIPLPAFDNGTMYQMYYQGTYFFIDVYGLDSIEQYTRLLDGFTYNEWWKYYGYHDPLLEYLVAIVDYIEMDTSLRIFIYGNDYLGLYNSNEYFAFSELVTTYYGYLTPLYDVAASMHVLGSGWTLATATYTYDSTTYTYSDFTVLYWGWDRKTGVAEDYEEEYRSGLLSDSAWLYVESIDTFVDTGSGQVGLTVGTDQGADLSIYVSQGDWTEYLPE